MMYKEKPNLIRYYVEKLKCIIKFNSKKVKENNNKQNKHSLSAKTDLRSQQIHLNKNTPRVEMVGYISCRTNNLNILISQIPEKKRNQQLRNYYASTKMSKVMVFTREIVVTTEVLPSGGKKDLG